MSHLDISKKVVYSQGNENDPQLEGIRYAAEEIVA